MLFLRKKRAGTKDAKGENSCVNPSNDQSPLSILSLYFPLGEYASDYYAISPSPSLASHVNRLTADDAYFELPESR